MGGAIARGLSTCDLFRPQDITVINRRASKTAEIQGFNPELQAVTGDYSSLATADIVVIAVKPWMVEALIKEHLTGKRPDRQIVISVAAGISLEQLQMGRKRQSPLLRNSQYGHRSKAKHDVHHGAECDRRSEQTGFEYFRCIGQSGIGGRAATRSGHDALLLRYRLRLPLYPGSDGGRGRAGPLPAKGSRRRSANPARGDRLARIQRLAPRTGGG